MPLTSLVIVGSTNPVKLAAVNQAYTKVWPKQPWDVKGYPSLSGVSNQPFTDKETIAGATHRAQAALSTDEKAVYGVGVEGGIQEIEGKWFACGWVVVLDKRGMVGLGSTARIIVPPLMMRRLTAGEELGQVIDDIFHTVNAKKREGHFGLMTNGAITRTSGYVDGVIMALARFLHPELFE